MLERRLTYEQAADILGCHVSNVPKLIRKGDPRSTGKRGGSLDREQVEALAERRAREHEQLMARRSAPGFKQPRKPTALARRQPLRLVRLVLENFVLHLNELHLANLQPPVYELPHTRMLSIAVADGDNTALADSSRTGGGL